MNITFFILLLIIVLVQDINNDEDNNLLDKDQNDITNNKIQMKVNKLLRPIIDKLYIHQTPNNSMLFSSLDSKITGNFK